MIALGHRVRVGFALVCTLGACGSPSTGFDLGARDAATDRTLTATDRDGDGLEDTEELRIARDYLPFLSIGGDDLCPTSGLVVRVTPAEVAGLVRVRYGWIFDQDCDVGTRGVVGGIGVLVDPSRPAPAGIVSLRSVSRPDSFCQVLSTCGQCPGQIACEALDGRPTVWAGVNRHAVYAIRSLTCIQTNACMARCENAGTSAAPPLVNVGEPEAPLVRDLTDDGFISTANGWKSTVLFHYDPYGGEPFGDGPPLRSVLDDAQRSDPPGC